MQKKDYKKTYVLDSRLVTALIIVTLLSSLLDLATTIIRFIK